MDRPRLHMCFYLYETYFNGKELDLLPGRRDGRQGRSCPWKPILIIQFAIDIQYPSVYKSLCVCLNPLSRHLLEWHLPPKPLTHAHAYTNTRVCVREKGTFCIDRDICPSPPPDETGMRDDRLAFPSLHPYPSFSPSPPSRSLIPHSLLSLFLSFTSLSVYHFLFTVAILQTALATLPELSLGFLGKVLGCPKIIC